MDEANTAPSPGLTPGVVEEACWTLADGVLTIDEASRIVYANLAVGPLLGYRPEELVGQSLLLLIPERLKERHLDGFSRYLTSGERRIAWHGVTFPARRKDGREISVELSFGQYALGGQRLFTAVLRDVSNHRRSIEALARSAESYRQLFEHNVAGVYRVDLEGRVLDVNDAMARMLGYRREELLAMSATSVYVDSADREDWIRLIQERRSVTNHVLRLRQRDGATIWTLENATLVEDPTTGSSFIVGTAIDISDRKRLEEDLERMAFHDPLTGLPNRRLLEQQAEKAFARAAREGHKAAMLYLDLVRFKRINDAFGHAVGDSILSELAARLRKRVRATDTVARLGGDEFAVLLVRVRDARDALAAAHAIQGCLTNAFRFDGEAFHLEARIGVALYPDQAADFDQLLSHADLGMYQAAAQETDIAMYRSVAAERRRADVRLEERLRRALADEDFVLHYQPICRLPDRTPFSVEALVRWRDRERDDLVPAAEFIALAEHAGLVRRLDRWVLRSAVRQARAWEGPGGPAWVAVNLSPATIEDPRFPAFLTGVLSQEGLAADRIAIEVTERATMRDPERASRILAGLRDMGIRIIIDDFGRGHSALAYLVHFPVDYLKVDRFFVDQMGAEQGQERLVEGILGLCRGLDLPLIAEGVETPQQLAWLSERGCEFVQGYFTGRPVPPEELAGHRPTMTVA